jgi:hypothetical protein
MKTFLAVFAFLLAAHHSVAADSLTPLRGRHAQQRHRQESLKLIEQQLAKLETLAKQAKGREAKRVREAIEVLLQSPDTGRQVGARAGDFARRLDFFR